MNWIKADNPPKDMHEVLIIVTNRHNEVTLGHYNYDKKEWFVHTDYEPVQVSHWMEKPLPPPCRATWEQLAYWLVDGKGLVLDADTNRVDTGVYFDMKNMHEEVGERYYVMARGDTEWHDPTVDYMGLEEE